MLLGDKLETLRGTQQETFWYKSPDMYGDISVTMLRDMSAIRVEVVKLSTPCLQISYFLFSLFSIYIKNVGNVKPSIWPLYAVLVLHMLLLPQKSVALIALNQLQRLVFCPIHVGLLVVGERSPMTSPRPHQNCQQVAQQIHTNMSTTMFLNDLTTCYQTCQSWCFVTGVYAP